MTMNTPVQNADDVAELVFAVVPNSARNSFDGTSGTITDALLLDERVIAVRNKFMNASDEELSHGDGCLSPRMATEEINTIMKDRIMINCAASEIVFSA